MNLLGTARTGNDLIILMPFSRDEHQIPHPSLADRGMDGLLPVHLHYEVFPVWNARENLLDDRIGRLRPRIIRSDVHPIRKRRSDPPHDRPLTAIPISAAAKDCNESMLPPH